ncbi:MAG: GldG family protein [Candidatus Hatepunaea meridiana]|nr:GldG family protein [Candidatus Hatepunaea meridiana]
MKLKSSNIFSPVNVLLIIVNIIVFNIISNNIFTRIDLTENRVYSLSNVTKEILQELPEQLTIKAYFTRDLPIPYNDIRPKVKGQLAEMQAHGKGNFRFEFYDPGDEENLKKEAERFRIEPMQVKVVKSDKVEFKLAYMGMVLIYEDRQEVIPTVQSLGNLEYEIVSKIIRITSAETQSIGFLEGHGEPALREEMSQLDQQLRKMYDLKTVNLTDRYTVPDDIDLLCVIGPKEDIPEKDRFAIDQFLMKGGKLLLAINKVKAELSQMKAERSPLRIDPWTQNYGFSFKDQLVMDKSAPTLPFQTQTRYGRQITLVHYPLFPELANFNREITALKALRQVRLYFPCAIDTSFATEMDSVDITPMFWSSEKSSIQSEPYDINPLTQRYKYVFDMANIPLGAVITGKFTSFWKDKSIPKDEDDNPITDEDIIPESPETRIVAIGDANFIHDQYIVPNLDNLTMMLNLVDWLVQDERLISIRSRQVSSRPIKEVTNATRRTVKYANLLIPPLLVIAFGLFRWRIRNSARKMSLRDFSYRNQGGKTL